MLYQSSSSKRTNNGNENPGETEQEEDECIGGIAAAKLVSTPASALTGDEEESYKQYERMSLNDCIRHAYRVLDSGRVLDKFRQMLLAQGAEPTHLQRALETPEAIPLAAFKAVWTYQDKDTDAETATNPAATYIVDIPAKTMGDVAVLVGAGRTVASDKVDGQAGLVFGKQTGDLVASGEIIVTIYTNRSQEIADAALERVQKAVRFETKQQKNSEQHQSSLRRSPIVTHRVTKDGGTEIFAMPDFLFEEELSV